MTQTTISTFNQNDIEALASLQPDGWSDITPMWHFYLSCGFCKPIKVIMDQQIVGIGTTILHQDTAWLAHIIVHKDFRGKGLGSLITKTLIDSIDQKQHSSIQLVATSLGEPIYRKLGFEKSGEYVFYARKEASTEATSLTKVIDYSTEYQSSILEMDAYVTDEKRENLLLPHLPKAKIIVDKGILQGFFLPTLGEGPIFAMNDTAGLELMKFKYGNMDKAVAPLGNDAVLDFFRENGFEPGMHLLRMQLGKPIAWKPQHVYGRVGGNLG